MEDLGSRSVDDGRTELESYYGGTKPPTNLVATYPEDLTNSDAGQAHPQGKNGRAMNFRRRKIRVGTISKSWGFSAPEFQRKKRVARYKVYSFEGRIRRSLKRSLRWFKNKCSRIFGKSGTG